MATKKKILLAEDDEYISLAYSDGISRAGFDVVVASDGEEAMEKIRSGKPDLILLDLIMPVKDGFSVLRDLKEDSELSKIPVIILSNLGQDSEIKEGKALGAVDYLVIANVSMNEVICRIQAVFSKAK